MAIIISLLATLLVLVSFTSAVDVEGSIVWNDLCPDYNSLGSAKVLLDTGKQYGTITHSGNFSIPDVTAGTYILSVLTHDFVFEKIRVDISESEPIPEVKSYVFGTPLTSHASVKLPYPVVLVPRHRNNYFMPRESFNLLGMFQNPMMMIMVLTGVMMIGMPYILKNLDPQTLEELQGRQAKVASIQNSMQSGDFKSGLSALLAADEDPKTASVTSRPSNSAIPQQRKTGKGNRRR
ncbi:hypothetical protein BJ138DRAFT_1122722 [Hygrophoropsis aurantiaca]|uniref:Uncharacterized protein n=1 Tax=Hygrophoropsis aurantiaca TaxID=72124 RepID=A0ACB8AQ40_9AGAM|nr:hypothetical protein BJ138DRAFT_1122722 [Hygrophoropsis aurantiaca]